MNKRKILQACLGVGAMMALIFLSFIYSDRATAQIDPQNQSDAIGIRVVPNPNHYSVSRWYESQGFSGSPQALTVDGYEALRDGRTVYINAAHVLAPEKQIYTNIYLISYNQDQSNLTTDILGQIIAHWKFNDNLPAETSTCSISAVKCSSDVDCPSNQNCSLSDGSCQLSEAKNCKVDDDCPTNFFCSSVKAKIIRDLNRVGKVEELRESLNKYRDKNGRYPQLSAGTYLPGVTTSVWPSWQESFLPSLGVQKNFLDPVNKLGFCPGYDAKTCWDKDRQRFVYAKESVSLKLPNDSYALVYSTNEFGSEYNLCAVMETRDTSDPRLGYKLVPNDPQGSSCVTATGILAGGNSSNTAPQITEVSLDGISGREYNGYIKASDKENDPLFWDISIAYSSSWSETPYFKSTNDPYQKKLFAERAGEAGIYPVTISVTDSKGLSMVKKDSITIKQASTLGEADEYIYRLDPVIPFNYSYYVSGNSILPSSSISLLSGPHVLNMNNIEQSFSIDGINREKISYSGIFSTALTFKEDTESVYQLRVTNDNEEMSSNNFIIKIKVDEPILDFNCETQVRVNHEYSCRLGSTKQGNHTIKYSTERLPAGLRIVEEEGRGEKEVYLKGKLTSTSIPGHLIIVKASNEYKTESTKSFSLRVNNYCGDGIKQGDNTPNTEGKGGMFNNGYEACDGIDSVATNVDDSSKSLQYACNTVPGEVTPYPITTYDKCIFKSPLDGGGYCGDTYCQEVIPGIGGETVENCPFDCNPNYLAPAPTLGGDIDTECSEEVPCPLGYNCLEGVCEIKCFDDVVIAKARFREGDATLANINYYFIDTYLLGKDYFNYANSQVNNSSEGVKKCCAENIQNQTGCPETVDCTYVNIDDPVCVDRTNYTNTNIPETNKISCPSGYSDLRKVGEARDGDKCRNRNKPYHGDCDSSWWQNEWCNRYIYECSQKERVCFGGACVPAGYTSASGVIDENGNCIAPEPPTPPGGGDDPIILDPENPTYDDPLDPGNEETNDSIQGLY